MRRIFAPQELIHRVLPFLSRKLNPRKLKAGNGEAVDQS